MSFLCPASILRIWDVRGGDAQKLAAPLAELDVVGLPGGAFAVLPADDDPAPFDTAVSWSQVLLEGGGRARRARILITPGDVEIVGDNVRAHLNGLDDDFAKQPPTLSQKAAYLTSWAAAGLEESWQLASAEAYKRPSGREIPLLRAVGPLAERIPWRNPELLQRHIPYVPRPGLEETLRQRLDEPVIRVVGALGCGKTRLVFEFLRRLKVPFLWVRAQPERRPGNGIAEQLARQLLEPGAAESTVTPHFSSTADRDEAARTWARAKTVSEKASALRILLQFISRDRVVHLVCDDFEQACETDRKLLMALAPASARPQGLRLWLVERRSPLMSGFEGAWTLRVPVIQGEVEETFARAACQGIQVPTAVLEKLRIAAAGHPFALEEGLIALIRAGAFRRSYGSFFFSGQDTMQPGITSRVACHVLTHVQSLGCLRPLLALSLAEAAVPSEFLAQNGSEAGPTWDTLAVEAGLLVRTPTPWGIGVQFACPAYGEALATRVGAAGARALRHELGQRLAEAAETADAHWLAYRLIEGTEEASTALLKASKSPSAQWRGEAVDAMAQELARLRKSGADPDTETLALWRLLSMARQDGRTDEFAGEIDRAVELTEGDPARHLAVAHLKAEVEFETGRHREAEATIRRAIEQTGSAAEPRRRAQLMLLLARIYRQRGLTDEAAELYEELYPALERQGLSELAAMCRHNLGNIAFQTHRLGGAKAHHLAALEARRRLDLDDAVSISLSALGTACAALGDFTEALHYHEEAQRLAEKAGSERQLSNVLIGRGRTLAQIGDRLDAQPLLRKAVELRVDRGDRAGEAVAQLALAENELALGRHDQALEHASEARFQLDFLSAASALADADQLLGRIQLQRRNLDEAHQHLSSALAGHKEIANERAASFDRVWLLEIALARDERAAVRVATEQLREICDALDDPELGERLDYYVFRGLSWLRAHGLDSGDPLPYLERSYGEILRKAETLAPNTRHRFLLEIPENRAVVDAASRAGLSMPKKA